MSSQADSDLDSMIVLALIIGVFIFAIVLSAAIQKRLHSRVVHVGDNMIFTGEQLPARICEKIIVANPEGIGNWKLDDECRIYEGGSISIVAIPKPEGLMDEIFGSIKIFVLYSREKNFSLTNPNSRECPNGTLFLWNEDDFVFLKEWRDEIETRQKNMKNRMEKLLLSSMRHEKSS